ncbi:hypothetical protein C8Q79DRAFT_994772 [Trametes meyenii]|nr:hypothetical protein C8Q79DRAFT_994772 [Trametes meyenii]
MDAALSPPLRVQPVRVQHVSQDVVQHRLDKFVHDFHARSVAKNTGESTTSAQLQKLADALAEEKPRKN